MPDLSIYIKLIRQGDVVAFPTETVYGLGADARSATAIKKVFTLKGRPADNPLIVHVASLNEVEDLTINVPDTAYKLMDAFWPGPLTLVLEKNKTVLDSITAGYNTVAIRMPDHPLALEFISKTGPLVAPSANLSGSPSPTRAEHVNYDFGTDFPVIDGGSTKVGLESTVLDVTGNDLIILRPGKIGGKEIKAVTGMETIYHSGSSEIPKSPGQKYSHYKPKAAVLYGKFSSTESNCLYLVQSNLEAQANVIQYRGDLERLSHELYDRFRQADIEGFNTILIEEFESYKEKFPSLYQALKNRIEKAVGN